MSQEKIIISALTGVAIGATLGILFAPEKGSETRKRLSKKKDEYVDILSKKISEFIDEFKIQYERLQKEAFEQEQNSVNEKNAEHSTI